MTGVQTCALPILEALIPDAQKEKVSASRPSDVFFPSSREAETQNDGATPHSDRAPDAESAATEVRSTRDLTATLLAPSQRKRASKSRSTSSSRTPAKSKQTTSVSRETTSDSAESADDAKKKTQRAVSTTASKKRGQSAGGRTAPKHPSKGSAETTSATTSVESDAAELKNILITFLGALLVVKNQMTLGMLLSVSYILGQLNQPILLLAV